MTNDKNHLIENRHIRLFISSTFRDLQDERDYLMKRTFPELRILAGERDVVLTELDLRWGITEDEVKNGKVVEICLREIEKSVPFFVGIIGNRYGWIPRPDDIAPYFKEQFCPINNYLERHLSVTEMEFQYGVLERSENMNAIFFIKDAKSSDDYIDEPEKLHKLKNKVIQNRRYPVVFYNSIEDLSTHLKKYFINLLDTVFPSQNLSKLEKVRISQRYYLNQLCETYVPNELNYNAIDNWLFRSSSSHLVITGESGIGKSALIANWAKRIQGDKSLKYEVIYYFIGNGGSEGNYRQLIDIICKELLDKYNLTNLFEKPSLFEEKELLALLEYISINCKRPLLIILDAINQLSNEDDARNLNWLPPISNNVKILLSTIETDTCLEIFKNRDYSIFTLSPLNASERKQAIQKYLGLFSKRLTTNQLEMIVNFPLCKNTLILRSLLDELVYFGIYELLNFKIHSFVNLKEPEEFYSMLLENYENEFGKDFIEGVLSIILVSKNGLSESEIMSILHVPPLFWTQFNSLFRRNFTVVDGLIKFSHMTIISSIESRYMTNEKHKEKYNRILLDWFTENNSKHSISEIPYQMINLALYDDLFSFLIDLRNFHFLFNYEKDDLRKYWNILTTVNPAKYSFRVYLSINDTIYEDAFLGYVYQEIGFFLNENYSNYLDVLYIYEKALRYRQIAFGEESEEVASTYNNMATTYMNIDDSLNSIRLYKKSLKLRIKILGKHHPDVATSYNNLAVAYSNSNTEESLNNHQIALSLRKSIFGDFHPDIAISYSNICSILLRMGRFEEGKQHIIEAIKIQKGLYGDYNENVAIYYGTYALTCLYLKDYDTAEKYYKKSLDLFSDLYVDNHPFIASCYDGLASLYYERLEYEKSLDSYNKALTIYRQLFKKPHSRIARLYNSISLIYMSLSDYKNAEKYILNSLSIYKEICECTNSHHVDYGTTCNNVGFFYYSLGEFEKAISYYKQALQIMYETNPNDYEGIAISINNIAKAYLKGGRYELAYSYQLEALKIQKTHLGEVNVHTARSYNNIGLILLEKCKYVESHTYMIKALEIRLNLPGNNRLDIADSYSSIGDLFYRQGQIENAKRYYQEAYLIYSDIFGLDNIKTIQIRDKILDINENNA